MSPFIVLVTQHVGNQKTTSQFAVFIFARSIEDARERVRNAYPRNGNVAYFTGKIYGKRKNK